MLTAPHEAEQDLRRVLQVADVALRDARAAVWDMRAPALEGRDVAAALEEAAHEAVASHRFADGAPVDLEVTITGDRRRLSPDVETVAHRVGREAGGERAPPRSGEVHPSRDRLRSVSSLRRRARRRRRLRCDATASNQRTGALGTRGHAGARAQRARHAGCQERARHRHGGRAPGASRIQPNEQLPTADSGRLRAQHAVYGGDRDRAITRGGGDSLQTSGADITNREDPWTTSLEKFRGSRDRPRRAD